MTLHAVSNLEDALAVTRAFLTPVSPRRWLKLALVVFFLGAGTNVPTGGFNTSTTGDQPAEFDVPGTVPDDLLLVGVAVVAVVVVLALLWALVGSIMEFVFVESLRSGEVTVRRFWRARWRQGLRLFGFRLVLGLVGLALVGGWLAVLVVPLVAGGTLPVWSLAVFLLGLPVIVAVGLLFGGLQLFTTVFVVPVMIRTESAVLEAWKQLYPSLRAEPAQYLTYALFHVVLSFAGRVVTTLLLGFAGVVLAIPFAVVALMLYLTVSLPSTVTLFAIGVVVVVFLAAVAVLWALLQVPVVTYLRYYALLVLGDIEAEFDLVPDRRAAVRREE